jgi:hypothetical protein
MIHPVQSKKKVISGQKTGYAGRRVAGINAQWLIEQNGSSPLPV